MNEVTVFFISVTEDDKYEIGSSVWNFIGFLSSLKILKRIQKLLMMLFPGHCHTKRRLGGRSSFGTIRRPYI